MTERLIFITGFHDTLDLYTKEFVKFFEKREADILICDGTEEASMKKGILEFAAEPVTAAICFNNIGYSLELTAEKNIWDTLEIPYINILMDHPFHYSKALKEAPQQEILLCMDENHVAYAKRFYPNIRKVGFLPHGGIWTGKEPKPLVERSMELFYAGGLSRVVAQGLIPDMSKVIDFDALDLSRYALEQLSSYPGKTTEEVIQEYLESHGVNYGDEKLEQTIHQFRFLDSFAVSFYRENLLRLLAEAGFALFLCGRGWEACEWTERENVHLMGYIPAEEIPEYMGDAKVVLNTMTWFKKGAHDRIYNGMLAGSLVVSDESTFVNAGIKKEEEALLFSLPEIELLPQKLREILDKPDAAQQIATNGYHKAKKEDLWSFRIEEYIMPWFKAEESV